MCEKDVLFSVQRGSKGEVDLWLARLERKANTTRSSHGGPAGGEGCECRHSLLRLAKLKKQVQSAKGQPEDTGRSAICRSL